MTTAKTLELLSRLRGLQVRLEIDGDRLRLRAPDGVLTPELREELADRKLEILAFLRGSQGAAPLPEIVPDPSTRYDPFPLTDVQQAYWIGRSGSFELGNVATHIYMEFEESDLDLQRFEEAWNRLVERHDMLRAIVRPDGLQQVLSNVPPYHIEVLDLSMANRLDADVQLQAVRDRLSHQVLPSDKWPLFELRVSHIEKSCFRIHVSMDLLIADALSWQILFRELVTLYQNPDIILAPIELSFRDCVMAEQALKQSDLYRRAVEYWRSRLLTLPPAPELPLAIEPAALENPRFVRRQYRLSPAAWPRLQARAMQAGLTSSAVLIAAYAQVLTMWSKNPRFTINLTLFNRLPLHAQIYDVIGDFTALTLLEIDNSEVCTFEVAARRLQEQLWRDMDHRYTGGVWVMRELAKIQGGTHQASMPVVFTSDLGNTPEEMFEEVYGISQTPQVWLDHQVIEQGSALVLTWDVVEQLFPAGMVDEMFAAYCGLLERLAEDNNVWQESTCQLLFPPVAQLAQQSAANATDGPLSGELLHTLFARQVAQRPHQTAVVTNSQRLSYAQLNGYSQSIAVWLRAHGAQRNHLVGIVMEKGWEQVAAVLGVLMAGAAYLPVSADLPEDRILYLLENGEVALVLTQSWLQSIISWPPATECLSVDELPPAGEPVDKVLPVVQEPDDLAYVIYTSGSTGRPKGVMIDHRGAVNTILDINRRFGVGPADRVLGISSLGFDLSVYDIFGILAAGGTLVLPQAIARRDPAHWLSLLIQEGITLWNSVPALMEMLVEHLSDDERLPDSLRLVLLSGDWIPVSLPDRIYRLSGDVQVISMGGATEASIWSILFPIQHVKAEWVSIPYGKPLTNQHFYVLDHVLAPRPVWVPGHLYIGGAGLARGYWHDADKTHASFVTHPRTGERLYATGDLGRYLPDGNIEFLGREDLQVKIQGHRIELGEIEAALIQHPSVQSSVVLAQGDPRGDKRLIAYFVPTPDSASYPATGSERLKSTIPQDYGLHQAGVTILDPLERLKFKLAHRAWRQDDSAPSIFLVKPEQDRSLLKRYINRRSYRQFKSALVPFEQLSQLLSCLMPLNLEGVPLPKYRYASAGSLYPVQVYLYVKPAMVEGLDAGLYYYYPRDHALVRIWSDVQLDETLYQGPNKPLFEAASFAMFLIAQLDAIRPLYGEWAEGFCMIEAGLISQMLEDTGPDYHIGLCQIGGLPPDAVKRCLGLEDKHLYLHSLLGGLIEVNQLTPQALIDESRDTRFFLQLLHEQESRGMDWAHSMPSVIQPITAAGALIQELRSLLRKKLPEYMIPFMFVPLDRLPLTANGKIDRHALPVPDQMDIQSEVAYVPPSNKTERTIVAVLQDVLAMEKVGVHESFFRLGANSLHIVQAHRKLEEEFGRVIPIAAMFEHATVADLASYLNRGQEESQSVAESQERSQLRKELMRRRSSHRHADDAEH